MKGKSKTNLAILVKRNKKRSCPFPFLSAKRKDGVPRVYGVRVDGWKNSYLLYKIIGTIEIGAFFLKKLQERGTISKCKWNIIDGWIKPNAFVSIGRRTKNPNKMLEMDELNPMPLYQLEPSFLFPFLFLSVKSRQGTLDIINVTRWHWMRSFLFPLWHSL